MTAARHRGSPFLAGLLLTECLSCTVRANPAPAVGAEYPQHAACVRVLEVRSPERAKAGEHISLSVTFRVSSKIGEDRPVFFQLRNNGYLYYVTDVRPQPPTSHWEPGAPVRVTANSAALPPDLPAGWYSLHAGIYGEMDEANSRLDPGLAMIEIQRSRSADEGRNRKLMTDGVYRDKHGVPHRWYINHGHTLVWDGVPWYPVGGMYLFPTDWNRFTTELELLKRWDITDIYLHLGYNVPEPHLYSRENMEYFQQAIDWLDENGFRYGTELTSQPVEGPGFYVEHRSSVGNITSTGEYGVKGEGTGRAVYMVYNRTLEMPVAAGEVRREKDEYRVHVDCVPGTTCELDVFVEKMGRRPYFWGGNYEEYRDRVLRLYRSVKLGPGFRFVVDPYYNEMSFHYNFVPSAPDYVAAFGRWLEDRYGNPGALNEAWRPLGGFEIPCVRTAARLLPLRVFRTPEWERGWLYDPETGLLYGLDVTHSQYWLDVAQFQGESNRDFLNAISEAFKTVADVPVIFKQCSDVDLARVNNAWPPGGQDGLGMEAYGTGEPIAVMNGVTALAEAEQHNKTAWVVVTETGQGLHEAAGRNQNADIGYEDRLVNMYANWSSLVAWGAKGVFHFLLSWGPEHDDPITSCAVIRDPRQLEWMRTYRDILESADARLRDYAPTAYYWYPALLHPNTGGYPFSRAGRSVHTVTGYWHWGMVARAENGIFILPTFVFNVETPRLFVNIEDAPESLRYRDEVYERPGLTWIGSRRDLGAMPAIDRYFTAARGTGDDGHGFQALRPPMNSLVLNRTREGHAWNMRVGDTQIVSREVPDKEGARPEYVDVGDEGAPDPWKEFSREVLGLEMLELGEGMRGFSYRRDGTPVACLWSDGSEPMALHFICPADAAPRSYYPDGTGIATEAPSFVVKLDPDAHVPSERAIPTARRGVHYESEHVRNVFFIEGLEREYLIPREQVEGALAAYAAAVDQVPDAGRRRRYLKTLAGLRDRIGSPPWGNSLVALKAAIERLYRTECPYIWIEGENPVATNFNLGPVRAMLLASGNAYLGLDSSAPVPQGSGYFARYRFRVERPGSYAVWLRELWLDEVSACSWRLDEGPWETAPVNLVPQDVRVISHWAPFDDERTHMAWYCYGIVSLDEGTHTMEFRVTEPRFPGNQQAKIREGEFAKSIDAVLFIGGGFRPNGKERPRRIGGEPESARLNLVENPSLERDRDRDETPDGWERLGEPTAEGESAAVYRVTPVGQLRRCRIGISCFEIRGGTGEAGWATAAMPVGAGDEYECRVWSRGEGNPEGEVCAVEWLAGDGAAIGKVHLAALRGDHDWKEHTAAVTAPADVVAARIVAVRPRSGTVWLDDFLLAQVPGGMERR